MKRILSTYCCQGSCLATTQNGTTQVRLHNCRIS